MNAHQLASLMAKDIQNQNRIGGGGDGTAHDDTIVFSKERALEHLEEKTFQMTEGEILSGFQLLGLQNVCSYLSNLAGEKVLNDTFLAACMRLGNPEMDSASARAKLADLSDFNKKNFQNLILQPAHQKVLRHLNQEEPSPDNFPDSGDSFYPSVLFTRAAIYGLDNPSFTAGLAYINYAMDLWEKDCRKEQQGRIATLLAAGCLILPYNGLSSESESFETQAVLNSCARYAALAEIEEEGKKLKETAERLRTFQDSSALFTHPFKFATDFYGRKESEAIESLARMNESKPASFPSPQP